MLARAAAIVVMTFGALNLCAAWYVEAAGLAQRPLEIQTRAAYQARLSTFFERPARARCVVMGDSLILGQHLEARHGSAWPRHTLSARFAAASRGAGHYETLNLGVNGVLFSELRCMLRDVLARAPELLLVNLSPRPFSADFRVPASDTERAFLCPAGGGARAQLNEVLAAEVASAVPVLRFRDMVQVAWFGAPPRERALQLLDASLARLAPAAAPVEQEDEDAELAEIMREMAWRTKAAARFDSIEVAQDHPQAAALRAMLGLLKEQRSTRVVLFYLKENIAPLERHLNVAHYQAQSERFTALVQRELAGSAVRFVVIPSERLAQHYTDHIHLDAQGYELLARILLQALSD